MEDEKVSAEEEADVKKAGRTLFLLGLLFLFMNIGIFIQIFIMKDLSLYENPMGLGETWTESFPGILKAVVSVGFRIFLCYLCLAGIQIIEMTWLHKIQTCALAWYFFSIIIFVIGPCIPFAAFTLLLATRFCAVLLFTGIEGYELFLHRHPAP